MSKSHQASQHPTMSSRNALGLALLLAAASGVCEAQNHASQERGSLEPAVVNLLSRLSPEEIKAVADYTSRLPAMQAH